MLFLNILSFINILDDDGILTSTTTNVISSLPSSDYMIWVEDGNNCISDTIFNVKLGEPGRIKIQNNIIDLSCYMSYDGSMDLSILSGTEPYVYTLEYDNNIIDQSQVLQSELFNINELISGDYHISVTDFNNCYVDSVFSLLQPYEIMADFVSLNEFGKEIFSFQAQNSSIGGDIYYWDFDNDSSKISSYNQLIKMNFDEQGTYDIMLVAHDTILGNQCNDTTFKIINVQGYDVFDVFSPNNDGVNDVFHFNEWMLNTIYVQIFNRWGQRIYDWNDVYSGWNGIDYNSRDVDEGVYFYTMQATGEDGTNFEERGSVTLIR